MALFRCCPPSGTQRLRCMYLYISCCVANIRCSVELQTEIPLCPHEQQKFSSSFNDFICSQTDLFTFNQHVQELLFSLYDSNVGQFDTYSRVPGNCGMFKLFYFESGPACTKYFHCVDISVNSSPSRPVKSNAEYYLYC